MRFDFCTVSDKGYLLQGLALYSSLLKHTPDFTLHYLCLDDESFRILSKHKSNSLIPYCADGLFSGDAVLQKNKVNKAYYSWSMASYFTNYLSDLTHNGVVYVDSDLFFHVNFGEIFEPFKDKDVAIFRHRQFALTEQRSEGWFNVGLMYFASSASAKNVLSWWADAVLHKKYPLLATCGDQKYLDAFPALCEQNKLFVDGNIGHGAPWQWQLYDLSDYLENGNIIWNGAKQKLAFTHFSQFRFSLESGSYTPSGQHHCYTPLENYRSNLALKMIYDSYFETIKEVGAKYL